MIYLSGHVNPKLYDRRLYGFLLTPAMGNEIPWWQLWAADTGCFRNPDNFDAKTYLRWLGRHNPASCLFATAPDVPYDMRATLLRSRYLMDRIRDLGFRVALVGQNSAQHCRIPWDEFDWWFVGGDDDWKLGPASWELCKEAKARGKGIHFGRVNSGRRLWQARERGADSADGTYLRYGPDTNIPKLEAFHSWVNNQRLFSFQAESTARQREP